MENEQIGLANPFRILAIYLIATAPPLLLGPLSAPHVTLAVVHLTLIGVTWRLRGHRRTDGRAAWVGLIAIPLLYAEIGQINQYLAAGYHDPFVMALESFVFGSPATDLAATLPNFWLSETLHLAYLSYYPAIYVPAALLFFAGRADEFRDCVSAVLLAAVVCFVVFVYFPVQGPRYFGPPEGVPDGPMRRLTLSILEAGSSQGAAFPSSHMSIITAQAVVQLRATRSVGIVMTIAALGVGIGAVYGGFHYAIDMVLGGAIGLAAGAYVTRDRK